MNDFCVPEGRLRVCERRIVRRLFGVASEINLLAIFIDFGVEPLAGTSANRRETISIYLSALVAAVLLARPSVAGVAVRFNSEAELSGVSAVRFIVGCGDLFFKGVVNSMLNFRF